MKKYIYFGVKNNIMEDDLSVPLDSEISNSRFILTKTNSKTKSPYDNTIPKDNIAILVKCEVKPKGTHKFYKSDVYFSIKEIGNIIDKLSQLKPQMNYCDNNLNIRELDNEDYAKCPTCKKIISKNQSSFTIGSLDFRIHKNCIEKTVTILKRIEDNKDIIVSENLV